MITILKKILKKNKENTLSKFELITVGEIRFGPIYCDMKINGEVIKDRIFGMKSLVSDDGRFVAFEEWLSTEYCVGPITRVLIYDLLNDKLCELTKGDRGFIEEFEFKANEFNYVRHDYGLKKVVKFSVDINNLEFHS